MVRGLVQKQDVRVLQNEAAQVHPGLLPAGEAVEQLLSLLRGDGKAVGDFIHRHVRVIAPEDLEPLGKGPVAPQQRRVRFSRRHAALQGLHFPCQAFQPGEGGAEHVLHGVPRRVDGDLGDEPQPVAVGDGNLSLVVVQLSRQYAKQGGFARAVPAQQAHPLPLVNLKGQAVQDVVPHLKGLDQGVDLYLNHSVLSFILQFTFLAGGPPASRISWSGTPLPARWSPAPAAAGAPAGLPPSWGSTARTRR